MKTKNLFKTILAFFLIMFFFACKKDSSKPSPANPELGYWLGSFTFSGGAFHSGTEGLVFKGDGTTVQYDFFGTTSPDPATCRFKAYVTYTKSGNTVNFTVTFPSAGSSGTLNETATINTSVSPNTMTGTYSGSDSGSFLLTKQ